MITMQKKSGLTVSDNQLLVGGKWYKMWSFYSIPFPLSHSHSHFHSHETSFATPIPIPMGIPLDPRDPWEFPIYIHLYYRALFT